jgi:hypothetical protein
VSDCEHDALIVADLKRDEAEIAGGLIAESAAFARLCPASMEMIPEKRQCAPSATEVSATNSSPKPIRRSSYHSAALRISARASGWSSTRTP